ncbi:MAG TPA: LuxR family transcriptional regulator [Cyanobacteria bacterium UBA11149]|nr:LuxR family transcriptional regulator [Cyanobacteria bacterium UBA11367]HBE56345.1 LuxR family transcriptional regulator [Cyanobacteria bacterium UBA11366]HBK65032.1 LuxR family transcriptional regulator [Cyanobacteria bacterium UBA11166]HBR76252.1 LuxR family transcriptional regulator [Cyanobacteria bacterium UBA11159]HBS70487.1 LuxR family transcriptional regulator [Cyanobacteria bacterium UBA11153]HBW91843.1 LuxR family transcriptional regulator [Cyanobacteria bacterium UBA11149]HCA9477
MSPISQESLKALANRRGVSEVEFETVWLALEGESTDAVAKRLGVSAIAVRKRLGEVYRKFEIGGSGPGKLAELKRILTSLSQVREVIATPRQDWGEAPDVSVFYGRTEELNTLKQWIVKDRCRLVGLLGMGGIGKTTLVAKLAREIEDKFDYIIWRSLGNTLSLPHLLADLIKFVSNQSETDVSEDIDRGISNLIYYLDKYRCLIVLDDVETILPLVVGASAPIENEGYRQLLKRVGQTQHQSSFLLISQETLPEIPLPTNSTTFVRSYQLKGLKPEESQEIFQEKKLTGKSEWEDLSRFAKGNPLALKIIAAYIQDVFNGNVAEFAKHQTWVFGDLRDILDQQFQRLSKLEQQILQSLASQENSLSLDNLKQTLAGSPATSEIIESLAALKRRDWIETVSNKDKNSPETLYLIPDMVKKYVTKYQSKQTDRV